MPPSRRPQTPKPRSIAPPKPRPPQFAKPRSGAGAASTRPPRRSAPPGSPPAAGRPRPPRAPGRPRSHDQERPAGQPPDTLEGWNSVLEGLKARRPMNKLLVAVDLGRHSGAAQVLGLAKERGLVVERVDRRALDRLSVTGTHQGVIAMVAAKAYVGLEDLLQAARRTGPPLLMVLDGIVDPQNLGAILRTAEGAGAHGVVIPERRAVGLTAAVARASAGAIEYMPVARVGNLSNALAHLARQQVWVIGVDPGGSRDYTKADYRQPVALVIGAEGKGLSPIVKDKCDLLVSIPMKGKVASLNASVAAGLVLYEALRQRR